MAGNLLVVQAKGIEGRPSRLDKVEEWLKALSFLSSVIGKVELIHHFATSFIVLIPTDILQCNQGPAGVHGVSPLWQL